jgi:hypothetical protein
MSFHYPTFRARYQQLLEAQQQFRKTTTPPRRFNYATFRAEYVRMCARGKERERLRERNAVFVSRPTEAAAEVRVYASQGRLTLTPLEKRLLYYDRLFLREHPDVASDSVTPLRAAYLARRVCCGADDVERLLRQIERVYWRATLLGYEVDDQVVLCSQERQEEIFHEKVIEMFEKN